MPICGLAGRWAVVPAGNCINPLSLIVVFFKMAILNYSY
jgi:hypothetical protein